MAGRWTSASGSSLRPTTPASPTTRPTWPSPITTSAISRARSSTRPVRRGAGARRRRLRGGHRRAVPVRGDPREPVPVPTGATPDSSPSSARPAARSAACCSGTGPRDAAGLERAAAEIRAALDGYERLRSRHPESTEYGEPYAACCQNLGIIHYLRKQPADAFAWFGKAEGEYRETTARRPEEPEAPSVAGESGFRRREPPRRARAGRRRRPGGTSRGRGRSRRHSSAGSPGNRLYQRQLKMTTDLLERLR